MTNEADKPSVEGLKPCPHCGGKAAFVPRAVNLALQKDPSDPKFGVSVICGTCSAETGNFIDEAAASLRWNRRASAAAPAEPPATPLREVLPPLPTCDIRVTAFGEVEPTNHRPFVMGDFYTAEQMRDFAIAALRSRLDGTKT